MGRFQRHQMPKVGDLEYYMWVDHGVRPFSLVPRPRQDANDARSAITTLLFSNYPLSTGAFTLGAFSLLSGLIATSLGTGLIYVLCSLKGIQYQATHSPEGISVEKSCSICSYSRFTSGEAWAMACFSSFYLACAVALWEANNKAWVVKLGVILSTVCLILHLAGFIFVFRREPAEAYDDLPPGN
ncbi:hypothetical protein D9756_001582 [Leucocoprinus leucothites]|uniref:Uncharacterized protein n=1 Tax=Leucocoprinus leucothites TaxID=201217 RepID=A0A8H5G4R8_9AGAR|nr:hypothetical protein D9756_001582 [Leucoagaricus leucothites]